MHLWAQYLGGRGSKGVSAYQTGHYVTDDGDAWTCFIQVRTAAPERSELMTLAVGREGQVISVEVLILLHLL